MSQEGEGAARKREAGGLRDPENLVGRTLSGKYHVIEVLARGGMGRIYRAEQVPLGRPVALKVLHSELSELGADPGFQKRFLLEAASCARLRHPNIVVVYDYGRLEELPYEAYFMAMELVEGRTLGQVLKQEGPFPVARALRIAREVARALREAHRQGMVHRDLKPSNVMLVPTAEGEQVKVLDFGLVKVMRDDSEELTKEGHFLGSPKYMAPEQIKRMSVDGRADLYALGVLMFTMLAGRPPFEGEQAVQTLMAHLTEPVPPLPSELGVPADVEAIVRRLMEKDPGARFPSADALIRAIDDVVATVPGWSVELAAMGPLSGTPSSISVSGTLARALEAATQPTGAPAELAAPVAAEPAPGAPRRGRTLAVGGVIAAAVVFAAAIAFVLPSGEPGRGGPENDEGPSAGAGTHGGAPMVPVRGEPAGPGAMPTPVPAPTPPAGPRRFTLFVASDPPGATLHRGDRVVGTTPTFVVLNAAELEAAPETFRVELEGYAPYVWTQGPSIDDVRIAAELQPIGDRARRPVRRPTRPPRPTTGTDPEPPPPRVGEDLSIKTRR
jgi:serine/threonine-protein kinase